MARLTLILSAITALVALLGGFRYVVDTLREYRWRKRTTGKWLGVCLLCAIPSFAQATYDLPNDDNDCPANCRQITWVAGSDLWNGGTLPTRTGVACAGLTEGTGTTDNTAAIESCLAAISTDEASVLPAGMYYVNGTLDIPANKSLRGANDGVCSQGTWLTESFRGDTGVGATCTTINLGTSGYINMSNGSGATLGSPFSLSSGYTKGSTSVVTATTPTGVAAGDIVMVSETEDTGIPVSITGESGTCTWCGDTQGGATNRPMAQLLEVESVSGTTINFTRPFYYTFQSGFSPRLLEIGTRIQKVGLEDIKVDGYEYRLTRTNHHIHMRGCIYCWVKNVDIFATPDVSTKWHLYTAYTYGLEVRDSIMQFGVGNGAGRNYATGLYFNNSDAKIENNIFRENRHCLTQEAGGSGNVLLYNYCDDQWTNDLTFLASGRMSHAAHPYMNLLEGNIISHYAADNTWGSSSHNVFFRNWLWGDVTGDYSGYDATHPNSGFIALDIATESNYYAAIGNVLGVTGLHTTWSGASVFTAACGWSRTRAAPRVYGLGCDSLGDGVYDSTVRSTIILHGNYDYKTDGQAYWDGGADHAIRDSMYYVSKPSFFGSCAWPPFDGTQTPPTIGYLPARERYLGNTTCDVVPSGSSVIMFVEWIGMCLALWHLRMFILPAMAAAGNTVAAMQIRKRLYQYGYYYPTRKAADMYLKITARRDR